ncbi:MAG: cytochrome C oxidase subunit II [Candidatus Eremiobacteraeota bacterium]|nr:cytochrome C oxidase subunit II [Candidatus Eremiobacteraeota bacterium]
MDSNSVFKIFVGVAGLAIVLMVWLGNYRSGEPIPQAEVTAGGYAIRKYWFWFTLIVAVVVFAVTIPSFPYGNAKAAQNARHVTIIAEQYGFAMPATVPLDTPIVFDVTSRDVNHGFGIYAPGGNLISQVQAMPDYVNHLEVTFTTPGRYTIRCLEYCGIAHASMQGSFDAK